MQHSGQIALDFFETVDDGYGIDEENVTLDDSDGTVAVPHGRFALTEEHVQQLQTQVNPIQESENHGIELYEQTLSFIHLIVSQNLQAYS